MAWIQSHQTIAGHPKTRKLAHMLGISKPSAIGHLHCFWWWALDYADDGDLSNYDALDISIGAEWDGDPDTFLDAMVRVGFIDDCDDLRCIHDWHDYAGKLVDRRKANAERMRQARADESQRRAAHVQRTQRARVEPEKSREDKSREEETRVDGADAPAPPPKPSTKGTRLPKDFTVTDDMRQWALSKGATDALIDSETEKFKLWWPAQAGQKGVKLDWSLTWKTWINRQLEKQPTGNIKIQTSQDAFDVVERELSGNAVTENVIDARFRRTS